MQEVLKPNALRLTKDVIKNVGLNIKALRLENNATQSDIAFYLETDKCIISAIERGSAKNITLLTLVKLSILFDIDVATLIS